MIAIPNGRLDTSNSPEAEQALMEHVEAGELKIVMDFAKTDYISSAGLRVLLKTAKILTQKGGKLALCHANEQIAEVLKISGFTSLIKCLETLDEAIETVSA